MNLYECEEKAKEIGSDSAVFDIVGPRGKKSAKWLDAYFGMFQIEGTSGFTVVNSETQRMFDALGLTCENLRIPTQKKARKP